MTENADTNTNTDTTATNSADTGSVTTDGSSVPEADQSEIDNAIIDRIMSGEDPVGQKPEPRAAKSGESADVTVEQLKALALKDPMAAFKALGISDGDLNPVARRFVAARKAIEGAHEAKEKALAEITRERSALAADQAKLEGFVQQIQNQYSRYAEAHKAIQAQDFEEALRLMTDGKVTPLEFAKAMAQRELSADPVARRQLAELREANEKAKRDAEEVARLRAEQENTQRAAQEHHLRGTRIQAISSILKTHGGDELSGVAEHPMFLSQMEKFYSQATAQGWKPESNEALIAELVGASKKWLLKLQSDTAILHGQGPKTIPTSGDTGATPKAGTPQIRRAVPALKKPIAEESDEETLARIMGT